MRAEYITATIALIIASLSFVLALAFVPSTVAAQTTPSYIAHVCASDGGSVAIYWGSSSGAATYAIRADNYGTYCGGFSGGNNNVGCVSGTDYVEDNNTSMFQFLYITSPGSLIRTWVHGVNGGSWSSEASEYFTCPVAAPTCSLSASSVEPGGYTTFYWSTTNAYAFAIYPAPGSMWMATPSSGAWSYGPLYSTQTFTGTANGAGGAVNCYATATVNQPPVPGVGITATPATVDPGGNSAIEWASSFATSCTGSGINTGGATAGTAYVSAGNTPGSVSTYGVTCSGAGGSTYRSTTVTVNTPPAPSCTVTLASSTVAYGTGTTLSWTSSNTINFYISNVGYVTPTASGSVAVQPSATTAYAASCAGPGGTVPASNGTQTLIVTPPTVPSANISATDNSIEVGESTTINASFTVASNDTLTYANIDMPVGTGLAATTTPGAKSYVFTPSVAGTYSFLARAKTAYYTSWTTYGTTTVTVVEPPPTCEFSASPGSVTQGQTVTIEWDCDNATSCDGSGFSTGGATEGSVAVTANSSTNYSISCTGVGGGTYNGVESDPVTVTCAPLYSCSDDDITYTDTDCEVETIDTCEVPAYCEAGQSACQFADIEFVEFDELPGGLTGHLQAQPAVIRTGDRTRLYWQISGALSCAVSGGGQNWTGLTSGDSGVQTNVLTQLTRYTLTCDAHEGHDDLEETFDVLITPSFNEH